jgi:hypothetical protein
MVKKDGEKSRTRDGDLFEQQLDRDASGSEVRKMETIVVAGHRTASQPKVVKMETIIVAAPREKRDLAGAKFAAVKPKPRKD